jgi:hypothetical protein
MSHQWWLMAVRASSWKVGMLGKAERAWLGSWTPTWQVAPKRPWLALPTSLWMSITFCLEELEQLWLRIQIPLDKLCTGGGFVYCIRIFSMANGKPKKWVNFLPNITPFWGWVCLLYTNVRLYGCPLRLMSASPCLRPRDIFLVCKGRLFIPSYRQVYVCTGTRRNSHVFYNLVCAWLLLMSEPKNLLQKLMPHWSMPLT